MPDPTKEPQPAADGTTFGKAAAQDEELVEHLVDENEDVETAREQFEARSAEDEIAGAHPPADADDRTGRATSFADHEGTPDQQR